LPVGARRSAESEASGARLDEPGLLAFDGDLAQDGGTSVASAVLPPGEVQ
jgi:hypothetical protein